MARVDLPRCGLYRTTRPLGETIPPGRLVYFHNHGDPGPGVYLPSGWRANRATWQARGTPIPSEEWASSLEPLSPEGFYRVREGFACCERRCRTFGPDELVQLGYDGGARPILFVPEWTGEGLSLPERGTAIDPASVGKLAALKLPQAPQAAERVLH
ncbi:MAG: hypothetical protein HYZ28_14165 [Myxococcales bacterium]|nr:hypothetical protein [Myxococcales bacterium]